MMDDYLSWGRYPIVSQNVRQYIWRTDGVPTPLKEGQSLLPYGNGRSYGDSCLNHEGTLIATGGLNHLIEFDPATGILVCEAGVLLTEILRFAVPQGWFLQVTPGTKHITVGGAIANDVHGKSHHHTGTFGCHVLEFELLRSDGSRMLCSPKDNTEWFKATIGGLGLTGLITWAKIHLRRIHNPFMQTEIIRYSGLEEFFDISTDSDQDYEYTVSWLDCIAKNKSLGRGLYSRGNHCAPFIEHTPAQPAESRINIPMNAPGFALNSLTVKAFNFLYYHKQLSRIKHEVAYFEPFFYPLDAIRNWNRMYGKRGFMQYQCVVPYDSGHEAIWDILKRITDSGYGSFLAVLKVFGDKPSPGIMSFPRKGVTLALDFANHGAKVFKLMDNLDAVVLECGGAVYPAKDARMSAESFKAYYPQWEEFQRYIDPNFSSSFWRRVTG